MTKEFMAFKPKCSCCGKFIPWSRSNVQVKSDGQPEPSLVEYEVGVCRSCEDMGK